MLPSDVDLTPDPGLRSKAARAAAWSGVSTIVLRLGSLVVGIVLARLLTPEQFGVYAVALTVQSILITVADLGLSADLIRNPNPERIAPTVATLGLVSGSVMTAITMGFSVPMAELLGSAAAAPAIAVLSVTLALAGATVVPYAMLQRRFQQREMFFVGAADFVVSTTVTLTLVGLGFGVVGLAIGRVAAQLVSSSLQFAFARVKPRYAIDRAVVGPVLAFGLPIAAANLLSWALLNVDNIVLARVAGATALGYYVLAFNVAGWPMSALAQVVRSISLPYFARSTGAGGGLASLTAIAWSGALPAGAVIAALAAPLIEVVYGVRWLPAAPVLAALGIYGSLRVIFDLFAGYLYARGRSRPVLVVQIVWLVAVVVGMVFATRAYGIIGAAWVHVAVAVVIVLPAYAIALRGTGVRLRDFVVAAWWPTVATIPAVGAALAMRAIFSSALPALLFGGLAAGLVYAAMMWAWFRRRVRGLRPGELRTEGEVA